MTVYLHRPVDEVFAFSDDIVGDPPQLGDQSDTTYAITWWEVGGNHGNPQQIWPAFAQAADLTSVALGIRARIDSAGAGDGWLAGYLSDFTAGGAQISTFDLAGNFTTATTDVTFNVVFTPEQLTHYQNALAVNGGLQVDFSINPGSFTGTTRIFIYETWLELDAPGAPVEEVWFASPIRQRQRADGLGLSSASRTSQLRTKQGSLRGGPNGVD